MFGRVALAGRRCTAGASVLRSQALLLRSRPLHSLGEVEGVHPPFAKYSHGVIVGAGHKMLYLSGQLGIDADGNVPESAAEQADLCFGAIKLLLADAGMSTTDVVKINAYVTDREHCGAYMQARDDFIAAADADSEDEMSVESGLPASTLLVVSGFSKPGKIALNIQLSQTTQLLHSHKIFVAVSVHGWGCDLQSSRSKWR